VNDESILMLQDLTMQLKEVYNENKSEVIPSFTPKVNEICVAKFTDDQWYRASVVQYNADLTARVSPTLSLLFLFFFTVCFHNTP